MLDDYSTAPTDTCPRCGGTIAPGASFCPECGLGRRPRSAALPPPSRRRPWVIIGVVAGGLAAIAIGALIAVALSGRPDVGLASDSPSPSQSAPAALPSSSDSPSLPATPTPVPTPSPNAELANATIADVTVDVLNLRSTGNESADLLGELSAGARVFTIGAPETVGDMQWYRVAVAAGPYSGGDGCPDPAAFYNTDIGWIASPLTGDPWLDAVDLGCPASPMTADELESLEPLERLHCFGNGNITVTGTINTPCCGGATPFVYEPNWLASPFTAEYFNESIIPFRFDPDTDLEAPERGAVITATAHHDDPASVSCRQSVDPEVDVPVPSTAWVVLDCRTHLVVTDYEVVGTEDLGPCCGLEPAPRPVGRTQPITEAA